MRNEHKLIDEGLLRGVILLVMSTIDTLFISNLMILLLDRINPLDIILKPID